MNSLTYFFERLKCVRQLGILCKVGRVGALEVGDVPQAVGQRLALDFDLVLGARVFEIERLTSL